MKPCLPRGLRRSTSLASRPLRRKAGVTGSIVSTQESSFIIRSDVLLSMSSVRRSNPSGVALTNNSPRRPAPTIGQDCAENRFSGRWLFAAAFASSFTRTGAAPALRTCGTIAVRIAETWVESRERYLASTGRNGLGGAPPPEILRSVPCLGMMTFISRRSCRGGLVISAIGLYSFRPPMRRRL